MQNQQLKNCINEIFQGFYEEPKILPDKSPFLTIGGGVAPPIPSQKGRPWTATVY